MRAVLILVTAFVAFSISACNTIAGMGEDTAAAGHAVTKTADSAK